MALRILLVDDDELLLESTSWMLEDLGHRVETASTGQEALDRLQAGLEVDLVLMDENMPGLSGSETFVRLRAMRAGLPVLLASGYLRSELDAVLAADSLSGVIQKPIGIDAFNKALARLVG